MVRRGGALVLRSLLLATALLFGQVGKSFAIGLCGAAPLPPCPPSPPDLDAPIIATQNQQLTNLDQFGLVGWNGGFAPQDNWAFNTDPIPPPPPQPSSADISAIATLFQNWVNSIPAKANFTAASLAASWVGFLVSAGIHQNVPVPFVKLDPVSGTTNPFNSQQVASTIQFGKDVSKALNLNSNQHLTIFGSFGYNDFSADAAAVGLRTNGGTIVGSLGAKWQVNSDYVRAWTGLNDGRASTQTTTAGNWNPICSAPAAILPPGTSRISGSPLSFCCGRTAGDRHL